jgi:hypothetical protein
VRKLFTSLVVIAGLVAALQASTWDKKTEITVNETVEVPGATLPPGKYVVKLADSAANRHIVMFMNEREDEVLSTVLAIPNQRMRATGESSFSFYERPGGEPPALRAWFYPGDTIGQEFAYPERDARQIEQATGEDVLSVREAESASSTKVEPAEPPATTRPQDGPVGSSTGTVGPDRSQSDTTMLAQAQPAQPQQPRQERPATGQTETDVQRDPTTTSTQEGDTLPETASPAPLFGLIGLLSLGGAAALGALAVRKGRRS